MAEAVDVDLAESPLWNPDLALTPMSRRTWSTAHIAALWIALSVVITTSPLHSGRIRALGGHPGAPVGPRGEIPGKQEQRLSLVSGAPSQEVRLASREGEKVACTGMATPCRSSS